MRWALEEGETAEIQRKRREDRGKDIPDHLWPPEILPGVEDWLAAFWELSTDRQIGMGAGPIPASAIARHTTGWGADEAETFRLCIRAMDRVYLRHVSGEPDVSESDNPARDAFRAGMRRG